jgi:hypothetical protein
MKESRSLANDAYQWASGVGKKGHPYISEKRRDSIVELAFFKAFLAWEAFLEETFVLYIMGYIPPKGPSPKRYYFPPNRAMVEEWLAEGKEYTKWASSSEVATRAGRHFENGFPFTAVLNSNQVALSDAKTIRNMIAHESASAQLKFENIVRRKLTALPPNTTVGSFLGTTMPAATPLISFFEFYISQFENCAQQIVPR